MKRFTSESVTEGHPDKICDRISDSVLDNLITQDPNSRVACETIVTTGLCLVMGEISTKGYADIAGIARNAIREIGYDDPSTGYDGSTCAVLTSIDEQSPDIALGVNNSFEYKAANNGLPQGNGSPQGAQGNDESDLIGAGDQGIMFGYATDETADYMPAALSYSHTLCKQLTNVRKNKILPYLLPDGKSQVTVQYDDQNKVERIEAIVVSSQHRESVTLDQLRKDIREAVIEEVIPNNLIDNNTKFYINPTGRFVVGGPQGDSGLTGRKIIVDTYGGYARHGGGCFSGKDPTKVDRSAAYMLRYIAKNLVAAALCKTCEIEAAYAIGVAHPVSVYVDTRGTGVISDEKIADLVIKVFDLRPAEIIKTLDLRRPIYTQTSSYGHFGNPEFPWEKLDKIDALKQ